jgi:hypothetical protein
MEGSLRCPNFKISSIRETFILPQFVKVPSILLYNEINLTKLKFEPSFVQFIYGRYLPLDFWSLNFKISAHRTVPLDLFYDAIWSRFDLSLSKMVGRYLEDFSFLALIIL